MCLRVRQDLLHTLTLRGTVRQTRTDPPYRCNPCCYSCHTDAPPSTLPGGRAAPALALTGLRMRCRVTESRAFRFCMTWEMRLDSLSLIFDEIVPEIAGASERQKSAGIDRRVESDTWTSFGVPSRMRVFGLREKRVRFQEPAHQNPAISSLMTHAATNSAHLITDDASAQRWWLGTGSVASSSSFPSWLRWRHLLLSS